MKDHYAYRKEVQQSLERIENGLDFYSEMPALSPFVCFRKSFFSLLEGKENGIRVNPAEPSHPGQ